GPEVHRHGRAAGRRRGTRTCRRNDSRARTRGRSARAPRSGPGRRARSIGPRAGGSAGDVDGGRGGARLGVWTPEKGLYPKPVLKDLGSSPDTGFVRQLSPLRSITPA